MKLLFLSAALACATSAANASDIQTALLWIPGPDSKLSEELQAIADCDDCRLTIALAPEKQPAAVQQLLKAEMAKGKLELALRVPGDPPLPLLFSPDSPEVSWPGKSQSGLWGTRLDILASVMFQAQAKHKNVFNAAPSGFVPVGGGATPQMIEPLSAYEMRWLATGPSLKTPFEVLESSGVLLPPFHVVTSSQSLQELLVSVQAKASASKPDIAEEKAEPAAMDAPLPAPSVLGSTATASAEAAVSTQTAAPAKPQELRPVLFAVMDESISTEPKTERPLLAEIMSSDYEDAEPEWVTVSTATAFSTAPVSPSDFPRPWVNDYRLWAGALKQRAALHTLGELRRAINVSANFRTGGHVGPKIAAGLSELERGDSLLLLASTDTATAVAAEDAFKQKVAALYRQAALPVPVSLRGSLTVQEPADTPEQTQVSTDTITVKAGNSYLMFNNPLKPLPIPAQYQNLSGGADPQQLFNIQAVIVEWTDASIKFRVRNRRLSRQERPLLGQVLLVDIYMDINHRRNSGTVNFLPGRKVGANPEDAWEYAVSIAGSKAQIYKTSLSGIQAGKTFNAYLDSSGDLVAEIPRAEIRGNPKLWGYSVLIMGSLGEGADRFTPAPLPAGDTLVDWLASDKLGGTFTFLRAPERY